VSRAVELGGAVAIAALAVALYLPTLDHGYVLDDQIRLRLAYVTAAGNAARAVDLVRDAAGMDGLLLGTPLERCWRDLHAVTQHFAISPHHLERIGKLTLGLDPGPGPV